MNTEGPEQQMQAAGDRKQDDRVAHPDLGDPIKRQRFRSANLWREEHPGNDRAEQEQAT
ncbi:MAG: hypothetical protein OXF88_24330 [Rhodobacteraceae bacterium]|nr:hypothetical protein [Paracoccaceae bacterium]MCY4139538.1 hypothetical protein [Paracoccaceae bacterium]